MPTFKPLRQKLGMITLGLACVLMVGWVRSQKYIDTFMFATGKNSGHFFASFTSSLAWSVSADIVTWGPLKAKYVDWKTYPASADNDPLENPDVTWTWKRHGFRIGKSSNPDGSSSAIWIIPYWSIVVPLTLLSAWLLLSKPNQPKPTSEPAE